MLKNRRSAYKRRECLESDELLISEGGAYERRGVYKQQFTYCIYAISFLQAIAQVYLEEGNKEYRRKEA